MPRSPRVWRGRPDRSAGGRVGRRRRSPRFISRGSARMDDVVDLPFARCRTMERARELCRPGVVRARPMRRKPRSTPSTRPVGACGPPFPDDVGHRATELGLLPRQPECFVDPVDLRSAADRKLGLAPGPAARAAAAGAAISCAVPLLAAVGAHRDDDPRLVPVGPIRAARRRRAQSRQGRLRELTQLVGRESVATRRHHPADLRRREPSAASFASRPRRVAISSFSSFTWLRSRSTSLRPRRARRGGGRPPAQRRSSSAIRASAASPVTASMRRRLAPTILRSRS